MAVVCRSGVLLAARCSVLAGTNATRYALSPCAIAKRLTSTAPARSALARKRVGAAEEVAVPVPAASETKRAGKAVATAATPVILRPYQEECVQTCLDAIASGVTRIGVSSPTGSGKTTMFTSLLSRLPALPNAPFASSSKPREPGTRVLIIVSSIELALQAANAVSQAHPDLLVEVEQGAKYVATGVADVTVATYQTLHRSETRLTKFSPEGFKAVIVDEAHHAAAPSYLHILSHFDPTVRIPLSERADAPAVERAVPIIGFSATFSRHDGLALGRVFDSIVWHRDFLDMIEEKWLCPVRFTAIKANVDLSSVRVGAFGDYQTSSLASVVNTPALNRLIVRSWLDRAAPPQRRSTLVFCVNIDHVEQLTDEFRQAGIDARYLHGGTAVRERRQLLEEFRAGVFPVLVNCAILTEGADVPAIDCVLMARPTRSRNIFSQMIGRGMRQSPSTGKQDCLILDVVGSLDQGVVCTPTLFGLDPDEAIEGEDVFSLRERSAQQVIPDGAGDTSEAEPFGLGPQDPTKVTYIDYTDAWALHAAMSQGGAGIVERMSRNAWVDCGGDVYVLDVPSKGYLKIERAEADAEAPWVSRFVARNTDVDEEDAAAGATVSPMRRWPFRRSQLRTLSPYRRPRVVLHAASLDAAVRGTDTYASSKLLRGSGGPHSVLSRSAPWRHALASEKQRAFVERRLGLDAARGAARQQPPPSDSSALPNLTKGQASMVLTRLQHGSKARWEREARAHNRLLKAGDKETARKERETVVVGPLRA